MIGEAPAGVGRWARLRLRRWPATAPGWTRLGYVRGPGYGYGVGPGYGYGPAPVAFLRQWWPFGYRQPPVEGNPLFNRWVVLKRHVVLWSVAGRPAARLAGQHAAGFVCPTGGRYQDCAGAEGIRQRGQPSN